MVSRRKHRRYEAKRPKSTIARVTMVIGIITTLLFVLFLLLSIYQMEEATRWMGSIGVIAMLLSLVSFGYGVGVFRDTGFDTLNRWAGMLSPLIGGVLWMWMYLVGIFWG